MTPEETTKVVATFKHTVNQFMDVLRANRDFAKLVEEEWQILKALVVVLSGFSASPPCFSARSEDQDASFIQWPTASLFLTLWWRDGVCYATLSNSQMPANLEELPYKVKLLDLSKILITLFMVFEHFTPGVDVFAANAYLTSGGVSADLDSTGNKEKTTPTSTVEFLGAFATLESALKAIHAFQSSQETQAERKDEVHCATCKKAWKPDVADFAALLTPNPQCPACRQVGNN